MARSFGGKGSSALGSPSRAIHCVGAAIAAIVRTSVTAVATAAAWPAAVATAATATATATASRWRANPLPTAVARVAASRRIVVPFAPIHFATATAGAATADGRAHPSTGAKEAREAMRLLTTATATAARRLATVAAAAAGLTAASRFTAAACRAVITASAATAATSGWPSATAERHVALAATIVRATCKLATVAAIRASATARSLAAIATTTSARRFAAAARFTPATGAAAAATTAIDPAVWLATVAAIRIAATEGRLADSQVFTETNGVGRRGGAKRADHQKSPQARLHDSPLRRRLADDCPRPIPSRCICLEAASRRFARRARGEILPQPRLHRRPILRALRKITTIGRACQAGPGARACVAATACNTASAAISVRTAQATVRAIAARRPIHVEPVGKAGAAVAASKRIVGAATESSGDYRSQQNGSQSKRHRRIVSQ